MGGYIYIIYVTDVNAGVFADEGFRRRVMYEK